MKPEEQKIKDILLKGKYVNPEDIKEAEKFAKTHRVSIAEYLLTEGIVTKDILGQAMAESFGVPYADLNSYQPSREQVLKISKSTADEKYLVSIPVDPSSSDPNSTGYVIKKMSNNRIEVGAPDAELGETISVKR